MYAAAKMGDAEAVGWHLRKEGNNADPNRRADDGYTALMTAAEAGHALGCFIGLGIANYKISISGI